MTHVRNVIPVLTISGFVDLELPIPIGETLLPGVQEESRSLQALCAKRPAKRKGVTILAEVTDAELQEEVGLLGKDQDTFGMP